MQAAVPGEIHKPCHGIKKEVQGRRELLEIIQGEAKKSRKVQRLRGNAV